MDTDRLLHDTAKTRVVIGGVKAIHGSGRFGAAADDSSGSAMSQPRRLHGVAAQQRDIEGRAVLGQAPGEGLARGDVRARGLCYRKSQGQCCDG